jgi:transposase
VTFLRHLLRHLRGPVYVLLDNASIHRGPLVRALLARHPRLRLEYFPSYAPELNPDEGVWRWTKVELANGQPASGTVLVRDVSRSLRHFRRSQELLRACSYGVR